MRSSERVAGRLVDASLVCGAKKKTYSVLASTQNSHAIYTQQLYRNLAKCLPNKSTENRYFFPVLECIRFDVLVKIAYFGYDINMEVISRKHARGILGKKKNAIIHNSLCIIHRDC